MIDNDAVFAPVRRVAFRRIGEQVVVVSPDENVLLTLNATGSWVWEQLDGERSVDDVARALAQEFAVTAEQALADVCGFLELMLERALIARVVA